MSHRSAKAPRKSTAAAHACRDRESPREGNECQQLGQLRPLGRAERREYPFFSGEVIGQNTVQERMSGIRELYQFSSAVIGAGFPGDEPRVFSQKDDPHLYGKVG